MTLTKYYLAGLDYLAAITDLLQRIRLESRSAGLYEAADLQWWWREDDAVHPDRQSFWRDETGATVASLLRYDAGEEWIRDFFLLPSAEQQVRELLYPEILLTIIPDDKPSTITVRDDDLALQQWIEKSGFVPNAAPLIQTELVGEIPTAPLAEGFRLTSRLEDDGEPHHLARRSGARIAEKLSQCSLYRPDLDLSIRDATGAVAAYALFWMDPVTKVGLLEPLRTESPFQRLGLARSLIGEGVRRLRDLGANVIKVSYSADNEAAARLYHHCGFQDRFKRIKYRRSPN